jgi:hypothetical protein
MISAFSPLKKYALTTDASMRERENKTNGTKREREKDRSHKRKWKRESKKGIDCTKEIHQERRVNGERE